MKTTLAFSAALAASAATDQPFDITWNGGALQAWGTCAQWSSSHCPLPCSSVTLDALVAVTQPETVGHVSVESDGSLEIGDTARVEIGGDSDVASCCAGLALAHTNSGSACRTRRSLSQKQAKARSPLP